MKNIFKIYAIAKPLHGLFAFIAFIIFLSATLSQVTPIISKFIVDEIEKTIKGEVADINIVILLIALSFILGAIGTILNTITERLGDHFSGKMRKYLTELFYDKVLRLSQSYFDSELSGKIVNQLNRGIFTIQNFLNGSTNFILPTFLQSLFTVVVLAYYSPAIAFLTFSLFPIFIFITNISAKKWGAEEVKKNKIEDIGRGRIQEVINNIKVVKGFTNELNEFNFIQGKQNEINTIYSRQSTTFHTFDFIRNISLHIILLGINVVLFISTFQGHFSIGELVLILQLVFQARIPLFAISFILTQIQMAESGSKEYLQILELEEKEDFRSIENTTVHKNADIEFKNVTFNYGKDEKDVLKNMSFKVFDNEKIAIIGESGSGKTTTINLIMKFYDPISGDILMNNKSYKSLTHNDVRANIALVFQDNELFSSTVKENVAYGMNKTDDEIIAALKAANAYEFVSKLKDGINSEVGERGVKLSGGQKQRIQIARAILKDAPILILDEATSSLDSKSELLVQEALENLMKDKLVIIIAHRFSTIQNVDRVIVLKDSGIEAIGSPKELSQKAGTYSELLQYQIDGNKKLLQKYDIF